MSCQHRRVGLISHVRIVSTDALEARRLLSDVDFLPAAAVTADGSSALVVADFNHDRAKDIAATDVTHGDQVSVLINKGDGTFDAPVEYAVGNIPEGIAAGPVNAFSEVALVVANDGDDDVSVLLGNGDGTFQTQKTFAVGHGPVGVAMADLNHDDRDDIVTANAGDNTISVLMGNGDGTFQTQKTYKVGMTPVSVVVANLKNSNPDIITANGDGTISILKGNGDGTFQPAQSIRVGTKADGIAAADLNNDGAPDLVVSEPGSDTIGILLNKGNGTFDSPVNYTVGAEPGGVAVADLNDDNIPDIVAANFEGSSVSVLLGKGDGTFQQPVNFSAGILPAGVAVADVNGDSRPDVITANFLSNGISVLQNQAVLAAPELHAPAAHAKDESNLPTFSWSSVGSMIGYRLVAGTDLSSLPTVATDTDGFAGAAIDQSSASSPFQSPVYLAHGTTYYWEVQGEAFVANNFEYGSWSSIRSFTTAPDVAPVVKHLAAASILKDTSYTFTGAFADPDAGDTWTATVNYGDGSGKHTLSLNSAKHFTLSHGYAADGSFTVTVVVTDNSGESGTAKTTVTVSGAGAGAVKAAAVPVNAAASVNMSTVEVFSDAERLKKLLG
jgi:hypothetical protein